MPHSPPNTPANTSLEQHWQRFRQCVSRANRQILGNVTVSEFCSQFSDSVAETVGKCRETRKRCRTQEELVDDSDEALSKLAKYTDALPLENYSGMLSFVPRMVNVVSLAEAIPVAGTATSLPLDLHRIASTCTNAYLAPRRFAAVQMAFAMPRCRVLVFRAPAPPPLTPAPPLPMARVGCGACADTGRLVGTGSAGPMAARLAIAKAVRQLAQDVNIHVNIRNFQVINTVGAVSIRGNLNCDSFASAHSATSHYDRQSFVGLAWRPVNECICCGAQQPRPTGAFPCARGRH